MISSRRQLQERRIQDLMKLSPEELKNRWRAAQERLRNQIGADFDIVWPLDEPENDDED